MFADFAANASGVISSYAEYKGYDEKKAFKLMRKRQKKNTKIVLEESTRRNIKPRDTALEVAKARILQAKI